jgi:hypothetical protein
MLSLLDLINDDFEFPTAISIVHTTKYQYCSSNVQFIDTKTEFQYIHYSL